MQEAESADCAVGRCWPRGVLVAIVLLTAFFRPGDTPWINDEPKLLKLALICNGGGFKDIGFHVPFTSATLGVVGLIGTRGARYGPAPIWLYQIFLLLTRDAIVMVTLRALIFSTVTAISLDWLARTMRLNPWLAVVTMLSPWLWVYSRQLWDNSFCIPLSALLIAAYADFLSTRRTCPLCIAAITAGLLPLTHLMSLALLAPLGLHLILSRANWRRGFFYAALIVLAIQIPAWPYWKWMAANYQSGIEPDRSPKAGYVYPLLGGHHLSAAGLGNLLGDNWQFGLPAAAPYLVLAAQYFSLLAYAAVWIGIFLALPRARRVMRRQGPSVVDHLAFIALGVLVCQSLLDGTQRVYDGPHYFNSTWIAYAILAYLAWQTLQPKWANPALVAQGAAMVIVLIGMLLLVAHNGGTRTLGWGTTMSQQVRAVEEIGNTPLAGGDAAHQPFAQWATCPWEYDVLKEMLRPTSPPLPRTEAMVRYRDDWPGDSHIVVQFGPR